MAKKTPKTKPPNADGYQLKVMRDTVFSFPQLYLEVFVVGDNSEQRAFAEMFVSAGCRRAKTVDDADLVVFTGGPDVNPYYYDETMHKSTQVDCKRDEHDIEVYTECLEKGIPMFGVCRGAQFLHVMNGGKLAQDVQGHVGDHFIFDCRKRVRISRVSSVHHQLCLPSKGLGLEIIADTAGHGYMWLNHNTKAESLPLHIEAFWYRDTCCFGVQGHPEYKGYDEYKKWCLEYIQELILENPDVRPIKNKYRLTEQHIEQRTLEWAESEAAALELTPDLIIDKSDPLDEFFEDDIPFLPTDKSQKETV